MECVLKRYMCQLKFSKFPTIAFTEVQNVVVFVFKVNLELGTSMG